MKKRFFAMVLSLALLIGFMPVMASAAPVQGWKKIDGSWYYSDPGKDGKLALGWKKIDGYWYYFAPKDGSSENGQPYHEGEMYGKGADRINGKWYYFGESYNAKKWGKLQYNWVKDTDSYGYVENWYYADPDKDGQLTQGWKKIGGYWYYFVKEDGSLESDAPENVGAMLDYGPVRINNKLYYFGRSFNEAKWGKLQYKWIKETETYGKVTFEYWYYADPNMDGQLTTGWKKIDGKWYYFPPEMDGLMTANKPWMVKGKVYAFNRDGSLHEKAGWVQFRTERVSPNGEYLGTLIRWAYTDQNGIAVTGWKKISDNWYYFDEIGYMVSDDWASDSLGTCWLDCNGLIQKNMLIEYEGSTYYVDEKGYMVTDRTVTVNGKEYTFGPDGKMVG